MASIFGDVGVSRNASDVFAATSNRWALNVVSGTDNATIGSDALATGPIYVSVKITGSVVGRKEVTDGKDTTYILKPGKTKSQLEIACLQKDAPSIQQLMKEAFALSGNQYVRAYIEVAEDQEGSAGKRQYVTCFGRGAEKPGLDTTSDNVVYKFDLYDQETAPFSDTIASMTTSNSELGFAATGSITQPVGESWWMTELS